MTELWGPDVSMFQGHVDWRAVKAAGAAWATAKASEGLHWEDPNFVANWTGIRAAGFKVRIAYHYGKVDADPVAQADHFLNVVGKIIDGDLLCLDIEDVSPAARAMTDAAKIAWVGKFLARLVLRTGLPASRFPVYTGEWWWGPNTGDSAIAVTHPVWMSDYETDLVLRHPVRPWKTWSLWQYTDKRHIPGIPTPCDASRFNGSLASLYALAGIKTPAPVKPPVKPVPPPVVVTPPPVAPPVPVKVPVPVVQHPAPKPPVPPKKQVPPARPKPVIKPKKTLGIAARLIAKAKALAAARAAAKAKAKKH